MNKLDTPWQAHLATEVQFLLVFSTDLLKIPFGCALRFISSDLKWQNSMGRDFLEIFPFKHESATESLDKVLFLTVNSNQATALSSAP